MAPEAEDYIIQSKVEEKDRQSCRGSGCLGDSHGRNAEIRDREGDDIVDILPHLPLEPCCAW